MVIFSMYVFAEAECYLSESALSLTTIETNWIVKFCLFLD